MSEAGAQGADAKQSKFADIFNYRDLIGDYSMLLVLRVIATLVLLYLVQESYAYHDPIETYVTDYGRDLDPDFTPEVQGLLLWGFILGFGLYLVSLVRQPYRLLAWFVLLLGALYSLYQPVTTGEAQLEDQLNVGLAKLFFLFFCAPALFGIYGVWKRRGGPVAVAIIVILGIGFLYTGETEVDPTAGLMFGLGLLIFIEAAYAAIKYDNYAIQFRPQELQRTVLTPEQSKSIGRRLNALLVVYGIYLGAALFVTSIVAAAILEINTYISEYLSDGQISDSVEMTGIHGIVFTALIAFLLMAVVRMFIGADYVIEEE